MPKFDTPQPISVAVELGVGNVTITATDRADTLVDIVPSDDTNDSDVQAAQRIRVDHTNGVLTVGGPRSRVFDFSRKTRSVDVSITVPSGSSVTAAVQLGNFTTTGRLGDCRFSTSAGNVGVDRTGPLRVDTSFGDIAAEEVGGNAEFHTGSGNIRIGEVDGSAVVKNSNGDTMIDTVTGDIRVRSANGAIAIDRTSANVEAKTSNGSIRLGEIVRGSVELATGMGDLEIGVATGTAALLEVSTKFGQVRNLMDPTPRPEASDETVEVHAHTSFGGITIRRS